MKSADKQQQQERERAREEAELDIVLGFGELTIEQLIAKLKTIAKSFPGLKVVASRDAEGNGFSPVVQLSLGIYTGGWRGEFTTPADVQALDKINALALWPA